MATILSSPPYVRQPKATSRHPSLLPRYNPHLPSNARTFALLLPATLAAAYGIWSHNPPPPLPAAAPPDQFSAERAIRHVEAACLRPHPTGSAENARVRQYIADTITSFGYTPILQDTTVVRSLPGVTERIGDSVANIRNVLVRIPGTAGTKQAVLYMAHYDSTVWGPGAADDWAGCATLLESLRALRAAKPVANDLIFLFTDAEEGGLKGAYAFAKHHPWIHDVALVVNFDVRGTAGPAYMYETGPDNGPLIDHFIRASTHPVANSFMSEIYYRMGVNSDYNVPRKIGLPGLNSAFIRNIAYYHTQNDTPAHLDRASLQHFGYNALDFARYFGNIPLAGLQGPNAIYFNAFGYVMVHYPASWAPWLTFAALALLLLTLRAAPTAVSAFFQLLAAIIAALLTAAAVSYSAWRALGYYAVYHNDILLIASLLTAAAAFLYTISLFESRSGWHRLLSAAHILWAAALLYVTFAFPGATFAFLWPLVFSTAALLLHALRPHLYLFALSALPILLLGVPFVYAFNDAFTALLSPITVLWAALLSAFLLPLLSPLAQHRAIALAMATAGIALAAYAILTHSFNPQTPEFGSISYALDLPAGKAWWLSRANKLNAWEETFFPNPARAQASEFRPGDAESYWKAPAPIVEITPAQWSVLSDVTSGPRRQLTLQLLSPSAAPRLDIYLPPDIEVFRAQVNGRTYGAGKQWRLSYNGFGPEPATLELELPSAVQPTLTVIESFDGLPNFPQMVPMPASMIFEPNTVGFGKGLRSRWTLLRSTFTVPNPK